MLDGLTVHGGGGVNVIFGLWRSVMLQSWVEARVDLTTLTSIIGQLSAILTDGHTEVTTPSNIHAPVKLHRIIKNLSKFFTSIVYGPSKVPKQLVFGIHCHSKPSDNIDDQADSLATKCILYWTIEIMGNQANTEPGLGLEWWVRPMPVLPWWQCSPCQPHCSNDSIERPPHNKPVPYSGIQTSPLCGAVCQTITFNAINKGYNATMLPWDKYIENQSLP